MCLGQRVQQLPGAVGRAIVDNDDLYTDIDGLDSPQHVLDRVTLIIDGDDYRQLGPTFVCFHRRLLRRESVAFEYLIGAKLLQQLKPAVEG
jgi:hypothetical protein